MALSRGFSIGTLLHSQGAEVTASDSVFCGAGNRAALFMKLRFAQNLLPETQKRRARR